MNERSEYTLYSVLVDGNNNIVDQSEFSFEVFPEINYETKEIETLEKDNEIIESVASEMGYETKMKDGLNTIVINDYELYVKDSARVNRAVNEGAKVVFMNLKSGSYQIANSQIEVSPTEMGKYFFVSPRTGHAMVKEFKPYDFRFWYDPKVDYIAPILSHYFKGQGWTPILSTGSLNWVEAGEEMIAVGELKYGKGSFIVCLIDMDGRLNANPTAKKFAGKLLN